MLTGRGKLLLFLSVFIFCGCSARYTDGSGSKAIFEQMDVFVSGTGGYDTYRIPAMVVTNKGTILGFCEGRKRSASDTGDIDLLLRRSTDNGKTWGQVQMIRDDGDNVCGNP